MRPSITARRRRHLTHVLAAVLAVSAMAMSTAPTSPSPLALGRPNPEGTSI